MQVNDLKLSIKRPEKKTIGRGGKKGTYSGKGNKGQKARSGGNVDPLFEGGRSTLIDHMKKKRGFTSGKIKPVAVRYSLLVKKFEAGDKITVESLVKKNVLKRAQSKCKVKIVGPKEKKVDFTFEKGIFLTESVKK
jgi:large subunit ribosomal protein L15